MERKHIITISGKPGSGKSSTADKVAELLGYTRYSSGDFVRSVIQRHGLSLSEFNKRALTDHTLDHEIDEELRKLRNQKDLVIDSRLGFYWIPESFKVYLDLDLDVATARIFRDMVENASRNRTESAHSIHDAQAMVAKRVTTEQERFHALYGVNPFRRSNFDLIINTARHSPQTVALTVFDTYKRWLKTETWTQEVSEVPLGFSLQ